MIATSHVIIGGAVGILTKNPAAALAAGIVSHIIADSIPHLDAPFKIDTENGEYDRPIWAGKFLAFAIIDSLFAFILTLYFWEKYFGLQFLSPFAWGAFGAYLPDLVDNFPLWTKQIRKISGFKKFHALHLATHNLWRFRFPMPDYWIIGAVTQIAAVLPALWYITR